MRWRTKLARHMHCIRHLIAFWHYVSLCWCLVRWVHIRIKNLPLCVLRKEELHPFAVRDKHMEEAQKFQMKVLKVKKTCLIATTADVLWFKVLQKLIHHSLKWKQSLQPLILRCDFWHLLLSIRFLCLAIALDSFKQFLCLLFPLLLNDSHLVDRDKH